MRYEFTDHEWAAINPMLPNKPRGVRRVNDRRVLNGIFWVALAVLRLTISSYLVGAWTGIGRSLAFEDNTINVTFPVATPPDFSRRNLSQNSRIALRRRC